MQPVRAFLLRQLAAAASARQMASGTGAALNTKILKQQPVEEQELPKPSYTYTSPGSSMREPGYGTGHSLSNPAYEYDPKPRSSLSDPVLPNKPGAAKQASPKPSPRVTAAAAAAQQASSQEGLPKPTYVYAPPGSSMREASYGFSVRDPVYVVDPAPSAGKQRSTASPNQGAANQPITLQPVASQPPPGKLRKGLAADDYANQSYVHSARGSMKEPHYVSISDPLDRQK